MKINKALWIGVGLAALLLFGVFLLRTQRPPEKQTIWKEKYNDLSRQHQATLHELAEQVLQADTVYQKADDTTKIQMVMDYARALSMGVDSLMPAQTVTAPSP